MKVPSLTHWAVAKAQVGLSYVFLLGFFGVLIAQGLGYIKIDIASELKDGLMLVLYFWFQRQRTSGDEPDAKDPIANPTQPTGANQPEK